MLFFIFYSIKTKIRSFFLKKIEKKLVIIRLDAIGDYILFRNYLKEIHNSNKFKDHKIILIGNIIWSDLAEFLDRAYVNEFIWVNTKNFWNVPFLRLIYEKFKDYKIDYLLTPTFGRQFIADKIAMIISAKQKVLVVGDDSPTDFRFRALSKLYYPYTNNIMVKTEIGTEFCRNHFLFEKVISEKIDLKYPCIIINKKQFPIPSYKYIVIFPGAGILKRAWPLKNFIEIILFILEQTNYNVIILGGNSEKEMGEEIISKIPSNRIINQIGTTTLTEVCGILANAIGVISNETSGAHISACLGTKTICLLGGGHFGRFMPYGNNFINLFCVNYKMECYHCDWNCIYPIANLESYPCIKNIAIEKVKDIILNNLN